MPTAMAPARAEEGPQGEDGELPGSGGKRKRQVKRGGDEQGAAPKRKRASPGAAQHHSFPAARPPLLSCISGTQLFQLPARTPRPNNPAVCGNHRRAAPLPACMRRRRKEAQEAGSKGHLPGHPAAARVRAPRRAGPYRAVRKARHGAFCCCLPSPWLFQKQRTASPCLPWRPHRQNKLPYMPCPPWAYRRGAKAAAATKLRADTSDEESEGEEEAEAAGPAPAPRGRPSSKQPTAAAAAAGDDDDPMSHVSGWGFIGGGSCVSCRPADAFAAAAARPLHQLLHECIRLMPPPPLLSVSPPAV